MRERDVEREREGADEGEGGRAMRLYHECPLLDLDEDHVSALRHPGQQHGDGADGQPAHVQATRRRVQLMDLSAARPERHQIAARPHWSGVEDSQSVTHY